MTTTPFNIPSAGAYQNAKKTAAPVSKRLLQSTLDALSSHIAILDERGIIVEVNAAWNRFACENNAMGSQCGIGADYLKVCDSACGNSSEEASAMAEGIRAMMAGQRDEFLLEYPCHSPQEPRWFIARATRFDGQGLARVVIAHENITARKRAEETLRASEHRLRLALEAGGLGAFEHTLRDDRILASPELCKIFELPVQPSFRHNEWVERMHPEDRSRVLAGMQRMLSKQAGFDFEYRICLPNGKVRWIRAMASLGEGQGKDDRVYGTVHDITERKESESMLRKLSFAINQNPASIVITDLQGGIEYVNPKFCAVTGYSFDEVRGKNPRVLKSGEMPAETYRQMWATITAGEEWHGEFHNRKKNGELYWESTSISAIRDSEGKLTHFVAIKEDITERKALERQMEQLRTERELILNTIGEGLHWIDADGRIKFENPAAAKMLGYEVSELIGQPAHSTMHHTRADGSAYPLSECPIYAILRDRVIRRVTDEVFWRKDGTSFAVEYTCTPVYEKDGRSAGAVVLFTDVTEHKRAQAELDNLEREAVEHKVIEERSRRALKHERELNQIKSQFVSMVSHEFRTPLCVINTAASLLEDYSAKMTGEERTEHTQEIERAVDRMAQMMDELLVHEKLQTGKMECKPSLLDMETFCRELISEIASQFGTARLINCAIDPDAREAFLDKRILRHILCNLLSNAVKYSQDNQHVTLEVKRIVGDGEAEGKMRTPQGDHIQLLVRDAGIGIPAADLAKLYQSFHRAGNVGNRPGTGMGLAIVKKFVDLHRGRIRFESTEGKGTSVWVWLPVDLSEVERQPAGSDSIKAGAAITRELESIQLTKK